MSDRKKVLARLRSHLEELTAAGAHRLAPERQLSAQLGVSRATLRSALATLEAEGCVWRHVGRGTFLGRRPSADGSQLNLIGEFSNPADIMEVRLAIEPPIAALAALRASQSEVAEMRECLRKARSAPNIEVFELWDGVLHATIAKATRNELLRVLFDAVNAVRERTEWGQLKLATLSKERLKCHALQHRKIVDAIAARNVDEAAQEMRIHLETVRDHLMEYHLRRTARAAAETGSVRRRSAAPRER